MEQKPPLMERMKQYWSSLDEPQPELVGCYPMGGGERPRDFFTFYRRTS